MTNRADGEHITVRTKAHIGQIEQVSHIGQYPTDYHDY